MDVYIILRDGDSYWQGEFFPELEVREEASGLPPAEHAKLMKAKLQARFAEAGVTAAAVAARQASCQERLLAFDAQFGEGYDQAAEPWFRALLTLAWEEVEIARTDRITLPFLCAALDRFPKVEAAISCLNLVANARMDSDAMRAVIHAMSTAFARKAAKVEWRLLDECARLLLAQPQTQVKDIMGLEYKGEDYEYAWPALA